MNRIREMFIYIFLKIHKEKTFIAIFCGGYVTKFPEFRHEN